MKENRMKAVLESIAQRNVPEDVNLWPQIAARVERKNFMQIVRTRPALAFVFVLLALVLLSGVAYAIGKVMGYTPGVGIVDQSVPLRILAEPVVAERDGLTVTVPSVVTDSGHAVVAYSLDGIVVSKLGRVTCGESPSLELPDGSVLDVIGVDDGGPKGARLGSTMKLELGITYSSIPNDVSTVAFTLPCILLEGTGPENWRIPLKLVPAPKNYATPAVEVGVTFVASNPEFDATQASALTAEPSPASVSGLHLDKVIDLPNSYILTGRFIDAGDLPGPLVINLDPYEDLPHMEDGSGNPITFKAREDIQPETMLGGVRYWAYEIPKPVQGPLTVTLDQINILLSEKTQFSFDAGSAPKAGTKWELNLPVRLRGYEYVIDSVEVIENGYLFNYHTSNDVTQDSLSLNITGYSFEQDNGRTIQKETVTEYSKSLIYSAPFPTGQLTVELIVTETVPLPGPWTLMWTPSTP